MSAGVHARAERTCHSEMSQLKSQIVDVTRDVSVVTHRKRGLRLEESQKVEFLPRKYKVDFRLLAEALWQVSHVVVVGGVRLKSRHRKIVPLSSLRQKNF